MKEVRLLNLQLNNFKGIKSLNISAPNGENLSIYGDNGTGKTTIADAFFWLLFGKDSNGRSDFEIKTLNADGTPIHFLDHYVCADMSINGQQISLQKTYREKWVKQRGSMDREFQGHETEFFINGIPKSKGEYTAYIKSIADEDVFKLLTNPMYFNNTLDKKKRREMLFTMFGNVSDAEVLAENSALLGDLADELGKYTLDELRTATTANKRRIDKDLQSIPSRIDEINRFIVDTGDKNIDELRSEAKVIEETIKQKSEALNNLSIDGEIEARRLKAQQDAYNLSASNQNEKDALQRKYFDCLGKEREIERQITDYQNRIKDSKIIESNKDSQTLRYRERLSELRADWEKTFNSNYSGDDKCPTCGQDLPAEQKAEAISRFNESKAKKLEVIRSEAENVKTHIEELERESAQTAVNREYYSAEIERLTTDLREMILTTKSAKEALDKLSAQMEEEVNAIHKEFLEWKMARLAGTTEDTGRKALEDEIATLRANLGATMKNISNIEQNEAYQTRIQELNAEARGLTAEYERLEKLDYLIAEFTKKKSSMLEDKINSKFEFARFKLFEQQINGGIVETCEVTHNGVPYSVLNNAMKINIGLDIINAFSKHYDLSAVIFLDNAESVTKIFNTDSQQIRLYVSETDFRLRIENN